VVGAAGPGPAPVVGAAGPGPAPVVGAAGPGPAPDGVATRAPGAPVATALSLRSMPASAPGARVERISADEARVLALRAQGLFGREQRPRTEAEVVTRLGAIQLDTISVLARSHELVLAARLGHLSRPAVEAALWGRHRDGTTRTIEYWAHAASVIPIELWPWLAFRRRQFRNSARWKLAADPASLDLVRRRLEADGPLSASELGGAKAGGPWWDWSPIKVAVEVLLDWGEVVCVERRGFQRRYQLAERAIPAALAGLEPDDEACFGHLVAAAGRHLGVATTADLADYFRLTRAQVKAGLPASGLVPVEVQGWDQPAWAHSPALEALGRRGRHRCTLLSPFDSMIWDRPRTLRLFGFAHRIEAYTPAPKRVHGYYPMPVLAGGRLVGRVDPARRGETLVAKQVGVLDAKALPDIAAALVEAAAWVGASGVAIERVEPPEARPALVQLTG
jgi:uncharacterized protein YcaQ